MWSKQSVDSSALKINTERKRGNILFISLRVWVHNPFCFCLLSSELMRASETCGTEHRLGEILQRSPWVSPHVWLHQIQRRGLNIWRGSHTTSLKFTGWEEIQITMIEDDIRHDIHASVQLFGQRLYKADDWSLLIPPCVHHHVKDLLFNEIHVPYLFSVYLYLSQWEAAACSLFHHAVAYFPTNKLNSSHFILMTNIINCLCAFY